MADEVLDSLQIKVTADISDAESKIEKLVKTLDKIKVGGISKTASDKLKAISDAAKGVDDKSANKVEKLASAISKLSAAKVPASLANQISKIGNALKFIDDGDIERLSKLTESIEKINASGGVGNIKVQMPKVDKSMGEAANTKDNLDLGGMKNGLTIPIGVEVSPIFETFKDDVKMLTSSNLPVVFNASVNDQFNEYMDWLRSTPKEQEYKVVFETNAREIGVVQTTLSDARSQFEEMGRELENNFDFGKKGFALSNAIATIKENLGGVGGAARTAFSFMANGMSAALPYAKKLASALAKIGLAMGKATGKFLSAPFVSLGKAISNTTTRLKGFLTRIGRIALYRAIRSAIKEITQGFKEGIDNAYEWSKINGGQLAKSMNSLATSAQYVKNSLGAMAAPLLNALAPAIDYVADKLVALINLFNQVFAKFTGASTWMRAKKQAVEYEGAANSATAATKKFKATILGIDEINPLNDNSDNGGGGGGGGADYGSMFEEVPVDSSIADFVQDIKDAIDAGDWEGVGSLISDKLVAAMDQIDWNAVYSKADQFGVNFASFLNGLFETKVDPKTGIEKNVFTAVGETAAGALNTALHFIDKVGETFNFKNFGEGLALGVTTFLNTFDWKTALSAAENWGSGVANALNGFLNKKDKNGKGAFDSIGETVGNAINTGLAYLKTFVPTFDSKSLGENIASAVTKAIQTIKWNDAITTAGNIGEKIAAALNGFLTAKDKNGNTAFSSLGKTVANLLVAGVNAWNKFTTTFNFEDLGTQIAAAINSFLKTMNSNDGWSKLISTGADTLIGIMNTLTTALKNVDKEEFKKTVGSVLKTAITKGIELITIAAKDLAEILRVIGSAIGDGLKDEDWRWNNIGLPFLNALVGAWNAAIKDFKENHPVLGKIVEGWEIDEKEFAAFATKLHNGLALGVNQKKDEFKGVGTTIATSVEGGAVAHGVSGGKFGDSVKSNLTTEDAKKKYSAAGDSVGGSITDGAKKHGFSGVVDAIVGVFSKKENKTKINTAGDTVGTEIARGAKLHGFQGIVDKLNKDLKGKNAKEVYQASGDTAAQEFAKKFKPYLPTLKVNAEGKFEIKHVYLSEAAKKELQGVQSVHIDGGGRTTKAEGGFVTTGQMFIAREAGPEYVGTIGNRTAVANNDQIVEGISSGVYAANQEQNALLRQQNALLAQLLAKDTGGGGQVTVSSIVTGVDRYNRRAGKTVMATA